MKTQTSFLLNAEQEVINPARAEDLQALAPLLQALGSQTTLAAVLGALQPLATLATQATQTALLAAVQALPRPSTKPIQVTLDLTAPLANQPVPLGGLVEIHAVWIRKLTGTLSLRFGGGAASLLEVTQGETRANLLVPGLLATSPGGGGTAQLEIHGQ
jgi:hypothetical protein